MRLFIAIDLPDHIKTKLFQIQTDLKKYNLDFKWIKSENIHLTLKFLGETKQKQLEEVKTIIVETSKNYESFSLNLDSFGFFPNERSPRIFFVSSTHSSILKAIANSLEKRLERLGFKRESRFKSHATLARIRNAKNIEQMKERLKNIELKASFTVQKITLYKSTLTNHGPIYEAIFTAQIK